MPQYRQIRNYENLNKMIFAGAKTDGPFNIPQLEPVRCNAESWRHDVGRWLPFNYAKTCKHPEHCGIHFFVDDYQFLRLWTNPDGYISMLSRFTAVMTPDFSTYTDFPKAIQIYNHYRKHWLGAYWQRHGFTVIPTISWSDEESLNWCFDGEPVGGTVAVSTVGTQMDHTSKTLFRNGYQAMLDRLKPETVLFYGIIPEECRADHIVSIAAYQEKLRALPQEKAEDTGKDNESYGRTR